MDIPEKERNKLARYSLSVGTPRWESLNRSPSSVDSVARANSPRFHHYEDFRKMTRKVESQLGVPRLSSPWKGFTPFDRRAGLSCGDDGGV